MELPPHSAPSQKFILALALILLGLTLYLAWPYLGAIVLALLLGFLLHPLYLRTRRLVRYPTLAASIVLALVTVILFVPLFFLARALADEIVLVATTLQNPGTLELAMERALQPLGVTPAESAQILGRMGEALGAALEARAIPTLAALWHLFASLIVFFILLFFVIRDGEHFLLGLRRLTPLPRQHKMRLYRLMAERTRAITLGTFLIAIIQGVAGALGWWFFDLPAPVFWGFVMTIIGVLPLGAPFMVLVPGAIWLLIQGNIFGGVGLLVYTGAVVGLIDDFARPYVVGRTAGVHPAVILIGTLGGIAVFGPSGFLLGPLLLSLLQPILQVWSEMREEAEGADEEPPARAAS